MPDKVLNKQKLSVKLSPRASAFCFLRVNALLCVVPLGVG